ncbi:MAG: hypothetical protein KUG65_00445 [Sphingomonadaceae bacterium]|nr:hypothetical protein [Sphingomonadaceae bacterium]
MKNIVTKSAIAALVAIGTVVPATTAMAQQKPVIAAPRSVLPLGARQTNQPIRYNIPTRYNWLSNWRRNIRVSPTIRPRIGRAWTSTSVTPRPTPSASVNTNARPAVMTPNSGPIGTQIRVQLNRNFGAAANLIRFRAVVSRGVPAQLLVRLSGSGNVYTTSAPIQLCIQGGGRWNADLLLTNGQRIDNIGTFTPTNCP